MPDAMTQATLRFDGPDLKPSDHARLTRKFMSVKEVMLDGEWHTHAELARKCGCSENGASARVRDLKKAKFGGYAVEKRRSEWSDAVWEYRVTGGKA